MVDETSHADSTSQTPLERGYVQIYTGDGKGKTTAALGLALRAVGAGLRVFIGQFIKTGSYSEIKALECLGDRIECRQYGRGCWIRGEPSKEDAELAQRGLQEVLSVLVSSEYDVVIVDEILVANWFGLVDTEELIDLIDSKPPRVELVLTGRRADEKLLDRADLVTEMREVKHYYQQGVIARKGIES